MLLFSQYFNMVQKYEIFVPVMMPFRRFTHLQYKEFQESQQCGKFALPVNASVQCVGYWLHLLKMPQSPEESPFNAITTTQTKNSYTFFIIFVLNMVSAQCGNGKGTGDDKLFTQILKQRLRHCHQQHWHDAIQNSSRYFPYNTFNAHIILSNYMMLKHRDIRDNFDKIKNGYNRN